MRVCIYTGIHESICTFVCVNLYLPYRDIDTHTYIFTNPSS